MSFFKDSLHLFLFHFFHSFKVAFFDVFIKVTSFVKSMFCNLHCLLVLWRMCTLLLQCEHACPFIVSSQMILIPEYLFLLSHFHELLFLVLPYQQQSIFGRSYFLHCNCYCRLMLLFFELWLRFWTSCSCSFFFNSWRDYRVSFIWLLHLLEPLLPLLLLSLKFIWLIVFKHVSPLIRGASLLN